jgi:predicted flap endonuclease-1-like 5' DNA nuclease
MSTLVCFLWWLVLGALLGWLASWFFGRESRPVSLLGDVVSEHVVERQVDNPMHLSRIAALEQEVADAQALRARVLELEAAAPKVVEKIVEVPVERLVEKPVEKTVDLPDERAAPDAAALAQRDDEISRWRERHAEVEQQFAELRRRTAELEGQVLRLKPPVIDLDAARSAGFAPTGTDDLTVIDGIDRTIAGLFKSAGISTPQELAQSSPVRLRAILADAGPSYRAINPDGWPEQAALAARNHWRALKSLQQAQAGAPRVDADRDRAELESRLRGMKNLLAEREADVARLSSAPALDRDAARAAGFELKRDDDLEVIEGIGPKVAEVLREAGIKTFHALAQLTPAQIKETLARGGPGFGLANPQTWGDQALLAAHNRWATLAALQSALAGGRRK